MTSQPTLPVSRWEGEKRRDRKAHANACFGDGRVSHAAHSRDPSVEEGSKWTDGNRCGSQMEQQQILEEWKRRKHVVLPMAMYLLAVVYLGFISRMIYETKPIQRIIERKSVEEETWDEYQCDGKERKTAMTCVQGGETFSQWLKRQIRNESIESLACYVDKAAMKHYATSVVPELAVPTTLALFRKSNLRKIDSFPFPNSFALKGVHGSGMAVLVTNGTVFLGNEGEKHPNQTFTNADLKIAVAQWLDTPYKIETEWQYRRIHRAAILEQFLGVGIPVDYKLFYFGGYLIAMDVYRFLPPRSQEENAHRLISRIMEGDGIPLDVTVAHGRLPLRLRKTVPMFTLKRLFAYANRLAEGFRFVRVDFYIMGSVIYFSELTFSPNSARAVLDFTFKNKSMDLLGRC